MRTRKRNPLLAWFVFVLLLCSTHVVYAESIGLSVRLSRNIPHARQMLGMLRKQLRAKLMQQGFLVQRHIRQGFHLKVTADIQELSGEEPPSCTILLRLRMILLPQQREVLTATANGQSKFDRAMSLTHAKRMKLRQQSTLHAVRALTRNIPSFIRRVRAKLAGLKKGQFLGKKVRLSSRVGRSGGTKPRSRKGRPLLGRQPVLLLPNPRHRFQVKVPFTLPPKS